MKKIGMALAVLALATAPLAAEAQPRGGDRGGGGFRGGSSAEGGGFRGGEARAPAAPSRGAGPAGGYGGYRGGYERRGGYRYGYRPYWGSLDLGFALGYSLAYPWYDAPWGYGYYGPAYGYGGYESSASLPPQPYYDDPFARDYGTSAPAPGTRDDGAACGTWVWNAGQSRYDWNTAGCP